MWWLPLILITSLYFIVAYSKKTLQRFMPINICAICVAVSVTWLVLLGMMFSGVEINETLLWTLIGMSIAGIMYKTEKIFKENKIRNFWFVRLVLIVGGLYSVDLLSLEMWNELLLLLVVEVFLIIIASFFFQKTGGTTALDNCC